jgi:DNA-binding NtrC family response regulator
MARMSPILCVVGDDEEASQFHQALASIRISNPVKCVLGASEALGLLDKSRSNGDHPVLVFLSLAAPEANRLAAWFEAHPQNRPAGLIAMTGFSDMRPVIQAYHLGVTAFLEWPLKLEDLQNALATSDTIKLDKTPEGVAITPR